MDVPKGAFLAVEHFALQFVPLLVHPRLGFRLHEDEFPFAGKHLLETGEVLGFVVGQLEPRLVLHRPLAEVDGVVRVLRLPAIGRPKVGRLESVEGPVVFDRQDVVLDREEVAVGRHEVGQVEGLRLIPDVQVLHHPGRQVRSREDGRDFVHKRFDIFDAHSGRIRVLHPLNNLLHLKRDGQKKKIFQVRPVESIRTRNTKAAHPLNTTTLDRARPARIDSRTSRSRNNDPGRWRWLQSRQRYNYDRINAALE